MESRKFDSEVGKDFLAIGREIQGQLNLSSDLNPQTGTRMSQMEYNATVSVAGTPSHIYQYQQPLQLRTSQSGSSDTQGTSAERLLTNSRALQSSSVSKSQGLTMLQRQLAKPSETGNQYNISLPLKLENLTGNIQFIAAKSKSSGGSTSLIPVVVSGDEIYQLQGGQGAQKNVLLLASPQSAQSATVTGSQNLNLTGLLSTSSKAEASEFQVSKSQTGFQEAQTVTGCTSDQKSGNTSGQQLSIGSVFSVPKVKGGQTVASPVYKSKLEKAMAQNLLMQSSAKSSGNKAAAISSVSRMSLPVTVSAPAAGESSQVKSDLFNRGSRQIHQEPVPQISLLASDTSNTASSVKSTLKVSKVAEYYKNLIAGKGIHPSEKQTFFQQPVEAISKPQSVPQYSIVPDVTNFHNNPKIMNVFGENEASVVSSAGVEVMTNAEVYSSLPSVSGVPLEQEETVIREKTYEDHCLGKSILALLWSLREESRFCDAVLYAGSSEIKLHKIVLIGASPEIYKRVASKTVDPELKLVLPGDLLCENIMTFLYYLYNGLVKLTVDNVQQIYRLSAIFGMTQLSKHCYDFCKVAKMGHVIIGSPYQEAAKQIQKQTLAQDLLPGSAAIDQRLTQTTVSTSTLLSSPKLSTKTKPVKKEVRDNFETISSDIDWMTNDPSQSNIPIRKRGRNRKAVQSYLTKTEENEAAKRIDNETVDSLNEINNEKSGSNEIVESNSESRNAHPKKNEVNRSEFYQSHDYEMYIENENDPKNLSAGNIDRDIAAMEKKGKQAELNDDFIYEITALPDPLVSGKLDENELLKLKEIDGKCDKYTTEINEKAKEVASQTASKPEVRRFRARANISVLEAASQMKAKSNDVTSISTPKGRKKRGAKKSIILNTNQTSSEIKKLLSNPAKHVTENVLSFEAGKATHSIGQTNVNGPEDLNEIVPALTDVSNEIEETNHANVGDEMKVTSIDEAYPVKPGHTDGDTVDEQLPKYPSAPKKAKLRKSTLEQQDLRGTVYMRPPPKKRTKEIREMMKNEEDDKQKAEDTEDRLKTSDEGKMDLKEVEKENSTKKIKQRRKRPKIKNDVVLAKVYEIEKLAVAVEAEKIYRCVFCSVEFKFVKRAITHLIGTHDIDLEDTIEYVSVEKKSENGKDVLHECDICGFRPKESGTYYIHYHKYFRHQVPLPKGWQAYKCDLCNKEFFTKFQLREHKLIHFEDNPFVCEQCGSGFRSRTCLNSHVFHKHSSVRKHKCPECPKTFKTATQMKVHKRVHTGEKPFLCPSDHCIYRSTTRGNMKLHLTSKHKLNVTTVKSLMESLEASPNGSVSLVFEGGYANETNKQTLARECVSETGAFDILGQTGTVENDVANNREQYVTGQIETIVQDSVMASAYSETVPNGNPSILNARDYSLVNQGTVPNQDLDMVMSEDNQMLENQNIPRHVELLIQDAHRFMQNQDSPGQNRYVQDFQQNSENEIQDMRSRIPEQTPLSQTFETVSGSNTSRFGDTSLVQGTHKIVDPHSKEARMMIREAFEGQGSRSLLKSAILHGNQDGHRLELGTRHLQDNSNITESASLLNEAEKLVIDLQDSGNHQIPLQQEDEVIQRLRSQIQQLRESSEQYRDSNHAPLFRNDHSVQEILLQNITSQQQTMEPAHFQTYHHSSGSPPAYSSSSHGLISDIEAESNVTLTPVSQDETQSQIHSLQSLQGQGYTPVVSQSAVNQYAPDGALYQGYYQEHYDIENY